uniref:DUF4794 domain-containing protein n=1 Tax=Glossina palpalis gambiensis TaxID=67801 RepID=A0A1B0C739_9MUSC
MVKIAIFLTLTLTIYIGAEPIRQRSFSRNAKQIQVTPAPAGYPAAGVTPEIPFELPTETKRPETVYGPPQSEQPDAVYGPPLTGSESQHTPDAVYGPPGTLNQNPNILYTAPDTEIAEETFEIEPSEDELEIVDEDNDEVLVSLNDDGSVVAVSSSLDQNNAVNQQPARLVYQRFPQRRQPATPVPERLTQSKILKPVNFVYTARYQSF